MTVENQTLESETRKHSSWKSVGIFFSVLGVVVLAASLTYGYFAIVKINLKLAHAVAELDSRAAAQTSELSALKQTLNDLQTSAQKMQDTFAAQENEWRAAQKGDLDKWHAAEAQYLVKLANDYLQFTGNIDLAMQLLNRADQSLQTAQDPNLLEIRKSLASDISHLQTLPKVDVTQLYLRLSAIKTQLEQLSLPENPLNPPPDTTVAPVKDQSWWQAGWERSWQALRKIVIVRYNGSNSLPLLLPQEKAFLYQNLHAQLENALWAVLNRNDAVYQASLARANDWIHKYFVQNETAQNLLKQIQELQTVSIKPPEANLSATLALFNNFAQQTAPDKAT